MNRQRSALKVLSSPTSLRARTALVIFSIVAGPLGLVGAAFGQAGGIYLPENGGPINGTAQAGSAAVARDAETAWLNPAGMTRLDSAEVMVGVMPFYVDLQFNPSSSTTATGSDGGNQGGWLPAGSVFLAVPVQERIALGFSLTSPGGLVLDPADDWVGKSSITKTALAALNFEPAVGVRLAEQWSVGAGLDVQYVRFEQNLAGPVVGLPLGIDGDSWDLGFSVSALWEPLETTRVGVRYRYEVEHDLEGDLTVASDRPVSTSFTLPMSVTLSVYHELTESLALMADLGWTQWSAFDRNVITFDGTGAQAELDRNFRDTWSAGLGVQVRPWERWILMFGASYVSSAVRDGDRTPDLPVDQQVRASTGVEYEIGESWTVGANYTFLWLGENKIDMTRPLSGRVAGDYDAFGHLFGLYGSFSF